MAALREIKERIGSVSSILKTTTAMKMVASAKFHRIQGVSQGLQVYEQSLSNTMKMLCADTSVQLHSPYMEQRKGDKVIVLALSSDTSLCGAFNSQVIRAVENTLAQLEQNGTENIQVWPVGEKMALAAKKWKFPVCWDFRNISSQLGYEKASGIAQRLMDLYEKGEVDKVYVVYNHFYSMGKQVPSQRLFLPFNLAEEMGYGTADMDIICEPSKGEIFAQLLPHLLKSRMYALLLNSSTAEFAARTVAMQTASDNAQELLDELKLGYNKRRQQAITDELADIAQSE